MPEQLESKGPDFKRVSVDLKTKLENLEQYLPGQNEIIYEFARFLAKRANNELVPRGFDIMVETAMEDIIKKQDRITGEPIPDALLDATPQAKASCRASAQDIKKIIFGEKK